ncbi:MAG: glycosyltransferase family 2 protein [Gammaproteobacteria bacterium]|nr:glycosyltransferase family 2 protein [Gammaproteobacteria bacterium]MDE0513490.1 glycosyltransferase family 2 protein [Gammaproteobacteria bacterium]
MAKICFVIPTYNEALNITALLRQLTELYPDGGCAFLVVDDRSPDGTAQRVREFMAGAGGRVRLLEAEKRGLGDAYIRGMRYALSTLRPEVIVQMDADFSHDPAVAARLLARVAHGADVAVGSRYVPGASLDTQWPLLRRWQSRCANLLARRVGGLRGVADCTAGFKAIRVSVLRKAGLESIRVKGYLFQPVLLGRLLRAGARVVEEPIHFRERRRGQTKLDLSDVLRDIWTLRHGSPQWTVAKFALTGLSGVFVNLGSFHLLLGLGLHKFLASPSAILLSILSNFLVNNFWTFNERMVTGRLSVRGVKYLGASLTALLLSYTVFVTGSMVFPEVPPLLLQAAGIPAGAALNYLLNSRWIFRAEKRHTQ